MCRQTYIFAAVTGFGCAALVALQLFDLALPAAAAKVLASCAYLAVAASVGALGSTYGRIIFAGLALSWFGDVFLIGQSRVLFLSGLVAFLLAHVAYIVAFAAHGTKRIWLVISAVPVAAIAMAVSAWLTPHVPADLLIPVRVYTIVISFMVIMAVGTRGAGGSLLILAGALLFYFSDLSVAALRLVQTDFPTYVWGLPFYYCGQLFLALSASKQPSSQRGVAKKSDRKSMKARTR